MTGPSGHQDPDMGDQPDQMANRNLNPRDRQGQFARNPATAERDAEAARLRSAGKSYPQIATELGMSVSSAHDAVKRAIAEVIKEPAEEALAFELRRLDEELVRLNTVYDKVVEVMERQHVTVSNGQVVRLDGGPILDDDPVLRAADRLIKIDEQRRRNGESRRRLLGLDQPAQVNLSGDLKYEIVGVNPEELT